MLSTLMMVVALAMGLLLAIGFLYVRRKLAGLYRKLVIIENQLGEAGSVQQHLSLQFRQVEALICLYIELKPTRSLPETRGWAGSPDFLLMLVSHAKEARPRTIVECGSGLSTLVLARSLALAGLDGRIYSLEHLSEFRRRTAELLARHEVAPWADLLYAPLREYDLPAGKWRWYALDDLPETQIDMLVVDGPPGDIGPLSRYPAGPLLFHRLSRQATIILAETGRHDEHVLIARWMEEFPDLVPEVSTCARGCLALRRYLPSRSSPA